MVNRRAMNHASAFRSRRTTSSERAKLLNAFDRSGLSAAAFARERQINYTTFCGWRQRREKAHAPEFIEVELPEPGVAADLVLEVGAKIRLRISSADQIPLAAALLGRLAQEAAC